MKKILVADDSKLERELIIAILQEAGIQNEILQAKNGNEALEILGTNFKDIAMILLDWQMPEMSGLEFMEGVMKVPMVADIPIIMITASGTDENIKQAKKVNMNLAGYIVKPYSSDILVQTVKLYLSQ